jgi:hypothetical protein
LRLVIVAGDAATPNVPTGLDEVTPTIVLDPAIDPRCRLVERKLIKPWYKGVTARAVIQALVFCEPLFAHATSSGILVKDLANDRVNKFFPYNPGPGVANTLSLTKFLRPRGLIASASSIERLP